MRIFQAMRVNSLRAALVALLICAIARIFAGGSFH